MISETYSNTYEHRLIEEIRKKAESSFIGDDCAVLPGAELATSDTLVEDTHFKLPCALKELGWKSVAVNISDIAAMAGKPKYLLINITMPVDFTARQFRQLYGGMVDCANAYRTKIVGGDLTRGSKLVLTMTVLGQAQPCGALLRSSAKPGDIVAVTGDFGASAAGLWLITQGIKRYAHCRLRHTMAKVCLQESWKLAKCAGNRAALMDASDGLADALVQIAYFSKSKIGMEIDLEKIPVHKETRAVAKLAGVNAVDWALYGGEDYELVTCLPQESWEKLKADNSFTAIGRVTNSQEVSLFYSGKPVEEIDLNKSFQHWCK